MKIEGAIHSTKIPTGPTGKSAPPQKVDQFFRNFSGWTGFGPKFPGNSGWMDRTQEQKHFSPVGTYPASRVASIFPR